MQTHIGTNDGLVPVDLQQLRAHLERSMRTAAHLLAEGEAFGTAATQLTIRAGTSSGMRLPGGLRTLREVTAIRELILPIETSEVEELAHDVVREYVREAGGDTWNPGPEPVVPS